MSKPEDSPLSKAAAYGERYDPGLLFSIERAPQRATLGLGDPLPFSGADLWTAYELSWLDPRGKPDIAIGRFSVAADSPRIIESKSLKLYLNSFSQTPFDSAAAVGQVIAADLGTAFGAAVDVELVGPREFAGLRLTELEGESIDDLAIEVHDYAPRPDLLAAGGPAVEETLVSHPSSRTARSPGSPTGAASRSATAVRGSTALGCCATSFRTADMRRFTSTASSGSSSTSANAAVRRGSPSTPASPVAGASISTRSGATGKRCLGPAPGRRDSKSRNARRLNWTRDGHVRDRRRPGLRGAAGTPCSARSDSPARATASWFVGDLVNRGPDSAAVVRFVRSRRARRRRAGQSRPAPPRAGRRPSRSVRRRRTPSTISSTRRPRRAARLAARPADAARR